MKLSEFDYYLPQELIAQEPLQKREHSRLLLFKDNKFSHKTFTDCIDYLNKGDLLVLNNTRVIPARLFGEKVPTGGKIEILLIEEVEKGTWKCLANPSRRIKSGHKILFSGGILEGEVIGRENNGTRIISFSDPSYYEKLLQIGHMPLPPYIKKHLENGERYQTIYSKVPGSIAAPTAGLHFTEELLKKIEEKGVTVIKITLHVGLGTFRPVKTEEIEAHKMEKELAIITKDHIEKINSTREKGGKIIAVGTTSVRTLESAAGEDGKINEMNRKTDLFIYPGYRFKIVDGIITNFHLPKSTLFMLVCAFIGTEHTHALYKEAIKEHYRFYSFGDASMLLK